MRGNCKFTCTYFLNADIPNENPRQFSKVVWNENLDSLRQFIDPNSLFQQLVAKDILTLDQQTEFHDRMTFIERRDLLLIAVPSSHHDDYLIRFIRCLRETSNENRGHSELITILTEAIEAKRGVFVRTEENKNEETTVDY